MESGNPPATPESAKGETRRIELDRAGQSLARRMAESKATVPHFYLRAEADVSGVAVAQGAFAQTASAGEPVPSFGDIVIRAVALALRDHPRANGSYRDGGLELYSRINVGIAVTGGDSLAFPTITDADNRSLGEIAQESLRLREAVEGGQITASDLAGATFTIFSLGDFGVRDFDPVIYGGQAGMLAVGEVAERAVVRDGELTAANIMELSLACDHRILYGAAAAGFLAAIRANLEDPERLT